MKKSPEYDDQDANALLDEIKTGRTLELNSGDAFKLWETLFQSEDGLEEIAVFLYAAKGGLAVLDVFLQILDAARVTMANGETLDLSGFYIVFTSNLGGADILNLQHSSFATMERHVLARAQQFLRPELFARITEKLVFDHLSYDVQLAIAKLHIERELAFLRGKGFNVIADKSIISFIIQRGFHPRLGARPLRDAIEKHLRGAIVEATLAEVGTTLAEFVVCANELIVRPLLDT